MTYSENKAFIEDIHAVLKKHGLSLMTSGSPERLVKETKGLEGHLFFFTKGENKLDLRGGSLFLHSSSLTVNYSNNKNTEDDGN
jgi:hypothetical protein